MTARPTQTKKEQSDSLSGVDISVHVIISWTWIDGWSVPDLTLVFRSISSGSNDQRHTYYPLLELLDFPTWWIVKSSLTSASAKSDYGRDSTHSSERGRTNIAERSHSKYEGDCYNDAQKSKATDKEIRQNASEYRCAIVYRELEKKSRSLHDPVTQRLTV